MESEKGLEKKILVQPLLTKIYWKEYIKSIKNEILKCIKKYITICNNKSSLS